LANILIASKDETLRDLLELSLQRFEHFVRLAEDGETSFKMVQEDFFDLALFEYEMPNTTALEILKRLKQSYKTVPLIIIVVTDFSPEIHKECVAAGAKDFVVKPFILPDLILRIEKMLKAANLVYRATRYRQMEPWA